jgi:hypothetical protein
MDSYTQPMFKLRLFSTLRLMSAFDPIIPNLIAVGLCALALTLLSFPGLVPNMGKYHAYLCYAIDAVAVCQVIKSATKSLLLPLMVIIVASLGLTLGYLFAPFAAVIPLLVFKKLMLMGVVGVGVSAFTVH